MKRTKRLARTSGLPRTGGLSRVTPMPRAAWARKTGKGTDPSPAVKAAVRKRDDYACARCGVNVAERLHSIHHRVRRSQRGRHVAENLVTLCGDGIAGCHGWVHRHPVEARAHGWLLLGTDDPLLEGVMYASEFGPGVTLWLTRDGKRSDLDPREAVA